MTTRSAFQPSGNTYIDILNMIIRCDKQGITRLPSENEISEALNISRIKARDALAMLEADSYIIRKRGIGTVINTPVLRERIRLDMYSSLYDQIQSAGHKADASLIEIKDLDFVEPDLAEIFSVSPRTPFIRIRTLTCMDDKPVCCKDFYVPASSFSRRGVDKRKLVRGLVLPLIPSMAAEADSQIMRVRAVPTDDSELAEAMETAKGFPLLMAESVCHSETQVPLFVERTLFNTTLLPLSLVNHFYKAK